MELCSSVKAGLNAAVLPQLPDDLHQLRGHGPLLNGVGQVIELSTGILCNPEMWLTSVTVQVSGNLLNGKSALLPKPQVE